MKTRSEVTCEDCFFRRHGLCALPKTSVCPTYRPAAATTGELVPPRQAQLVPRPAPRLAFGHAS